MSLTHTLLPASEEAFALRLIEDEQEAWQDLLGSVTPTFGDSVADRVAEIMRERIENDVPYSQMGDMIRSMLYVRYEQRMERESFQMENFLRERQNNNSQYGAE